MPGLLNILLALAHRGFDRSIVKPTTESRTSDTSLSNDSDLFVDLETGKTYHIEGQIFVDSGSAPDTKVNPQLTTGDLDSGFGYGGFTGLEVVSGTAWVYTAIVWVEARLTPAAAFFSNLPGSDTAGTGGLLEFSTVVTIGATGGRFSPAWGQDSFSLTASTVAAGSWMHAREVTV